MFAKVAAAVKAVKPAALLSSRMPVDYNCLHFNHSLHQSFDPSKNRGQLMDTAPLRVALPDYQGLPVERRRPGPDPAADAGRHRPACLVRTSTGWPGTGRISRPSVAMTFYQGDSSCPNPKASRADLMCRLMRGRDERPGFRPSGPLCGPDDEDNLRDGQVLLLGNRAICDIQVSLDYLPAEAWIYDLDLQTPASARLSGRRPESAVYDRLRLVHGADPENARTGAG